MTELEIFQRLGLALAIGLLIGLERGWHTRERSEGTRVAGVRTFALMGLLGGICGWLAVVLGPIMFGFIFIGYAILITASYWIGTYSSADYGITTEIAALLVFSLGAAAMIGELAPVAAAGVLAAALLSVKSVLHRWIERMQELELTAAIELAIISVVMLPFLPNQGYGPGGILNPYQIWWAVVLVAGLSFIGYFAIRIAGLGLGTLMTGLLGGLASSTATTLSFAKMAKRDHGLDTILAVGAVLAGSVTFLRIIVLAYLFNAPLARDLAAVLVVMTAVGVTGALILYFVLPKKREPDASPQTIRNPLELSMAVKFGGFLAIVQLAIYYFEQWFGDAGILVVAALSGITDVDALTISTARIAGEQLDMAIAVGAILIAASVNTVVKSALAFFVGGREFGLRVTGIYAVVLAAGAACYYYI